MTMATHRKKSSYMNRQTARRRRRQSLNRAVILIVLVAAIFVGAFYMLSQQKKNAEVQQLGNLTYVKTAPGLNERIINYKGMTVPEASRVATISTTTPTLPDAPTPRTIQEAATTADTWLRPET